MDHRELMIKRIEDMRLSLKDIYKREEDYISCVTYYWFSCVLFDTELEEDYVKAVRDKIYII